MAGLRPEVRDEHFSVAAASDLLGGVVQFDSADVKSAEDRANLRNVVQRQDEFAP